LKQQAIRQYLENNNNNHSKSSLLLVQQKYFEVKKDVEKQIEIKSNENHNKKHQKYLEELKNLEDLENQLTLALLAEQEREDFLLMDRERSKIRYYKNREFRLAQIIEYQKGDNYKEWKKAYTNTDEFRKRNREYMREYRAKKGKGGVLM